MPDYFDKKAQQRKLGITARKGIDPQTAVEFSRLISEKLIASEYAKASTIMSYQPFNAEVDLSYFHNWAVSEKKQLAFPLCIDAGKMIALTPFDDDAWKTGKYGIKTPIERLSTRIEPAEIDLIIVPCTAFNGATKMRCGMGAGYYDRYLPLCKNAVKIAVAFEAQHIDDLCIDDWDVPLDYIITELHWY
jgi:5-formyltetrahydrofolate cyclo-ligase